MCGFISKLQGLSLLSGDAKIKLPKPKTLVQLSNAPRALPIPRESLWSSGVLCFPTRGKRQRCGSGPDVVLVHGVRRATYSHQTIGDSGQQRCYLVLRVLIFLNRIFFPSLRRIR